MTEYKSINIEMTGRLTNPSLILQENRIDYIQLLLTYGKKNMPGETSGTDTEDDEDDETRKTRKELKQRAKAKEMTMEVEIYLKISSDLRGETCSQLLS